MAHSYILALAAPKEGNTINKVNSNKKAKEDVSREKATKPRRKRTSRSQIQKVSPYFTNDCDNKAKSARGCGSDFESGTLVDTSENIVQEKGEENGNEDEIAIESVKFQGKKASKKHKLVKSHEVSPIFQSDNRKVDTGSLGYDVSFSSVALPGSGISFLVDKLREIASENEAGEVKFNKLKKKKAFDLKLLESRNEIKTLDAKTNEMKLKAQTKRGLDAVMYVSPYFQQDGAKKIEQHGLESHVDTLASTATIGDFFWSEQQESAKQSESIVVKSKKRRKFKNHKTSEECAEVRKVSPYFKKDNVKMVQVEAVEDESGFCSDPLRGTCGDILQNKVKDSGDEIGIRMSISKGKRASKKHKLVEHDRIANVSHDNGKLDAESHCHGCTTGSITLPCAGGCFLENNFIQEGNIKPKKKQKKKKAISDMVLENANSAATSSVKSKKKKLKVHKTIADGVVRYVSPYFHKDGGKNVETIAIKSKKRETIKQKTAKEIPKVSAYFRNDDVKKTAEAPEHEGEFNSVTSCTYTDVVHDKREENEHIISMRVKPQGHECLEHALKFSPFFQSANAKKADAESCYGSEIGSSALLGSDGSFLEDVTENVKVTSNKKRKSIADKLQENANDTETDNFNSKMTAPIVQKNIANATVKHVSQYLHKDSGKKINVKTCDEKSKSESIARPTCGKLREGKLQETHGNNKQQGGLESFLGSVALTTRDLFENERQDGNEVDFFEKFSYKRNSISQKTLEHDEVRKVSPYFQTQYLTGCKQVEKAKKVRKNMEVTDPRTSVKGKLREKSATAKRPLSASEKMIEAYKRKTADNTWKPPRSEFSLLQEDHAHDPWRVLVICMLLNLTTGRQAKRVLSDLFNLCPDAKSCTQVATEEIEEIIKSLGLQKKRSMALQRLSREYLDESWTHVTQLHGVGKYGADAYAIFCTGKWDQVRPTDSVLNKYWEFLHTIKDTL